MKNIFIILLLSLIAVSCRTVRVIEEVPIETIKTEYITNHVYDSIYVKDSIDRWVNGDTIFLYKYHTAYKYRDRVDTLIVRDTIPKIVKLETTKEIKVNEIYWWQKVLMWLGGVLSLIGVIIIIYKLK